jgi:hypothetical protein
MTHKIPLYSPAYRQAGFVKGRSNNSPFYKVGTTRNRGGWNGIMNLHSLCEKGGVYGRNRSYITD